MRISTKGRYATRAMLDLALHEEDAPVQVKDISERIGVSERYLEQLLGPLKVAGLVQATRGSRGGFTLARPASDIRLSQILRALEGSMAPAECVDNTSVCSRVDSCATRQVWSEIKYAVDAILESNTLQAMVQRHNSLLSKGDEGRAVVNHSES